jgi:Zn-dependent peptidase ImmA (M78 family)
MTVTAFKTPAVLLDELGITDPSEIDVNAIAEYCGATVIYERLSGTEARIIGFNDRAIITVNSQARAERQRFSAAHDLGHWMRDRGKIAFSCTEINLVREWDEDNPERRANRYAADLLLPSKLFQPAARRARPTFEDVRSLAMKFHTSVTATAIRLIELGDAPAMIVASDSIGRQWFIRSPLIRESLFPLRRPGPASFAARLLSGELRSPIGPDTVDADQWIDDADAKRYTVVEDSVSGSSGIVLTLLWWKDESQILESDDEGDEHALSGELSFGRRRRR